MDSVFRDIYYQEIFAAFIKKWWLIAGMLFLFSGVGYYVTDNFIDPTYQAEAVLFIGKENTGIGEGGLSLNDLNTNDQLFIDYQQISGTRLVISEVNRNLGTKIPIKDFKRAMKVSGIENSRLFAVSFTSGDPRLATDVANELARQLTLAAATIVSVENIRIVDTALLPEDPIRPSKMINTAISGFMGALFALSLIFISVILDNTISREEDLEKMSSYPIIGVIPKFKGEVRE